MSGAERDGSDAVAEEESHVREAISFLRVRRFVVLTAEEARKIAATIVVHVPHGEQREYALSRLTPSEPSPEGLAELGEREDDFGPPAPGEGSELPNPEIGMEC
jgi:hypothetical protein